MTNLDLIDHLIEKEAENLTVFEALDDLAEEVFHANREKGFWDMSLVDINGVDGEYEETIFDPTLRNFGEILSLIVEEIGEAVTANRKDLMDDHLPDVKGQWAELADVMIRCLDVCGAHDIQIGTIIKRKLDYNRDRPYRHGKKY